jgi:hypothetical protein
MEKIFSVINIKRTIPLLCLLAMVFTGCKKNFLDRESQGQYTQDTYPYPGGSGPYDTYLFAAYSQLRAYNVHSQFFICATTIRSDDADKGSTASDGGADASNMDNFPVSKSSSYVNGLWTGYYGFVDKCNIAINQIHTNTSIVATQDIKIQSEAEARFLRGYAYFMLVRMFGNIPLVDSVFSNSASQSNVPQSTPDKIYALIESDLQYAAQHLPASWDPKFIGRATSGAANGLLAKVYLTEKKWAAAMGAATAVMNSGQYDLSTPYTTIFGEAGENSKESVFEVQATATFSQKTAYGVQYAQIMGIRGSGVWNLGWGWCTPSTDLYNAYEANDPRRDRTIMVMSTSSATPNKSIYGESFPLYNPAGSPPNPMYNGKVYTSPANRAAVDNFGYWMNIRILRYADVVLMYAEAANEVGGAANITAARNAVNSVRARARNGALAGTLPDITTTDQSALRDIIRHERRIELAMEHDRFFDIVRWGIAQSTLNAAGKTNFSDARDVLLPIPQAQIDISAGVLKQNPGY